MIALYDRYAPHVYSVALRALRNTDRAEQTTADVFMEIWRNPDCLLGVRGSLAPALSLMALHPAQSVKPETNTAPQPHTRQPEADIQAQRSLFPG